MRRDCRACFLRRDDRKDLELDEVTPVGHPLVQKHSVVAVHHLKAALEVGRHPARNVSRTGWGHPPLLPEATIDRLWITIAVLLDHHEEHVRLSPLPGSTRNLVHPVSYTHLRAHETRHDI